ncbi:MAG: hypothetical protein EOS54_09485 [Mesorhizobium sp.]|uniref:hypothetical protein n=1 Tax=unclassified Mesorhizobium TaxID=325217 RepID=UPI000F75A419|nr:MULTISPECIES: hypothetical protein [unclassified Mesorhizobium]AZO46919.1 hypothetical protein EJ073_03135 [Mesorhizobium sp. M4B.F.Ca.ET.058.02.1.1]RWC54894.1 MAG: hypothetical protein EOS54_09485 [Mesorhizobium sp.]TIU72016.1 MAG: hypothetical protein E5W25_02245 [Mesorhizobium sp.]TIV82129.1 MAG: hypothetical protein E5V64_13210 [Mesorhizobium sp.]TIW11101.1 MAG: hypothetical protein E5V66_14975 [Mesorhizobium sp.]
MADDKIEEDHDLLRYVPFSKLRKADGTDDVIGVLPEAFALREAEPYLSATWIEYFASQPDPVASAVRAVRNSALKVTTKSGFTKGKLSEIRSACKARGHQIRIVHEREPDNDAHVAVRRYPADDLELFESLATDAWSDWFLNSSIP